ncbi:hypothetical protein [Micromonospora sp. DT47]
MDGPSFLVRGPADHVSLRLAAGEAIEPAVVLPTELVVRGSA